MAQEEAAVTEAVEEAPAVQEEEEESGGSDDQSSGVNCKLYFGNLPYNCDSAQLAGIVQDYGSPELVEVLYTSPSPFFSAKVSVFCNPFYLQ